MEEKKILDKLNTLLDEIELYGPVRDRCISYVCKKLVKDNSNSCIMGKIMPVEPAESIICTHSSYQGMHTHGYHCPSCQENIIIPEDVITIPEEEIQELMFDVSL